MKFGPNSNSRRSTMRKLILTSLIAFGLLFGTLPTVSATPNTNHGTATVSLVYHPMQRYSDPRIQKQEAGAMGLLYYSTCNNNVMGVYDWYIGQTAYGVPAPYLVFLGYMSC